MAKHRRTTDAGEEIGDEPQAEEALPPGSPVSEPPKERGARKGKRPVKMTADDFEWGWLVKHASFGSLRVKRSEAKDYEDAMRVFWKRKAPGFEFDKIKSGFRASPIAFIPAETERGDH